MNHTNEAGEPSDSFLELAAYAKLTRSQAQQIQAYVEAERAAAYRKGREDYEKDILNHAKKLQAPLKETT